MITTPAIVPSVLTASDQVKTMDKAAALAAGIRVGVYVYSEAINENEAIEEAQFLIDRVQQYKISLPLVIDYEGFAKDQRIGQAGLSKEQHTSIVSCLLYPSRCV